jgi:hypothetical protein
MRLEGWPRSGPHGSPGDAERRPETALTRLLTMRVLTRLDQPIFFSPFLKRGPLR